MNASDFTVLSKLGSGSYGQVLRVLRKSDNCQYAMKKVKIMDLKERDKKNALNEVRMLASIEHPNVVQYKEAFFDSASSHLCVVMELARAGDLAAMIQKRFKQGDGFYQYEIWKIGSQILAGLKHLHSLQIIHRDLKPANLFFTAQEQLKIGDLNVSRTLKEGLAKTQTGTPNYASPEIWNNEPYSYDCDVWSFGCIIYELCCFRPPFRSKDMSQLYRRVQEGIFERIPRRYSFMLEDAIKLCLQKREKRAAVDQLLEIFQKYSSSQPQGIAKSTSSVLLSTIEFPKNKDGFSQVLPSPKYSCSKEKKAEPLIPKRPSSSSKGILARYMKPQSELIQKKKRLSNQVYIHDQPNPQVHQIQSQKLLPAPNLYHYSLQKDASKDIEKQLSFKQVLKSLEDARMVSRRIQRGGLLRKNLRLIKF